MAELALQQLTKSDLDTIFPLKETNPEGILKGLSKEYSFLLLPENQELSSEIFSFLAEQADPQATPGFTFQAMWIKPEEIDLFVDMSEMMEELEEMGKLEQKESLSTRQENTSHTTSRKNSLEPVEKKQTSPSSTSSSHAAEKPAPEAAKTVYSSVFALAKAISQNMRKQDSPHSKAEQIPPTLSNPSSSIERAIPNQKEESSPFHLHDLPKKEHEKEREKGKERQHGEGQQEEKERRAPKKNKTAKGSHIEAIGPIETSFKSSSTSVEASSNETPPAQQKPKESPPSVDSIFIRFMALMARILGQAEAEAHELYLKIKARTDDIDTLTHLVSKINSTKGTIDWTKDEEMKKLIERARELGVDIPAGKYKWNEDEKKLLKENIHMRKESMEKITQLERTDMQRYLQEASQCHQARSNVLKLLKEVLDTIIHNMRPG